MLSSLNSCFKVIPIIFLFIFLSKHIYAQDFRFRHITQSNGLSSNTIFSIFQDSVGFIWIGSSEGLNRYDSKNIKKYELLNNDVNAYGNSVVYSIFQDSNQDLFFGTRTGLFKYNRVKDQVESVSLILNNKEEINAPIYSIVEYGDKYLFLATLGYGLYRYDKDTKSVKKYSSTVGGLNSDYVTKVLRDGKNRLWVLSGGSSIQFYNVEKDYFDPILIKDTQEANIINNAFSMSMDSHGQIWIGGMNSGLFCFNPNEKSFKSYLIYNQNPIVEKRIHTITNTDPGILLLGTDEGLIELSIKTNSYKKYTHNPNRKFSISDDYIYTILKDRDGGTWVGTYWGGVNYSPASANKIELYSKDNMPDLKIGRVISSFVEDSFGNVYIATDDNGLYYYNRLYNTIQSVEIKTSKNALKIHCLLIDQDLLYIGTYGEGLYVYNTKTKNVVNHKLSNEIAKNSIYALTKDGNGRLWLGKRDGIVIFDELQGKEHVILAMSQNAYVMDILEDDLGCMWFASMGEGVIKYDLSKQKIKYISKTNKNWPIECRSLYIHHNKLFIGTSGMGLWSYSMNSDESMKIQDGLVKDVLSVYHLLGDEDDLWMMTDQGLIRYNISTTYTVKYNEEDGLQGTHFNPNAGIKVRSGELFVGGANGFNIFYPSVLSKDKSNTPISIEYTVDGGINVNESAILFNADQLQIKSDFKQLSLSFTALYYQSPSRVSYRYKLNGFDQGWFYTDSQKTLAQYTNIPPGEYEFIVMTSVDGVWNDQNKVIKKIIVLPFWYQTRLFYICSAFFAIFVLHFSYRYYLKKAIQKQKTQHDMDSFELEKRLNDEKISFFTHIAHEIRTPAMLISAPVHEILKKESLDKSLRTDLHLVKRSADKLNYWINQILDFTKYNYLADLEKKQINLTEMMFLLLDKLDVYVKKYNCSLEYKAYVNQVYCVSNIDALNKVFNNLIINAIKFSKGKVLVHVSIDEEESLLIHIDDDGGGIDDEMKARIFAPFFQANIKRSEEGFGIGLTLVKQLLGQLDLELVISKSDLGGARFTVVLKKDIWSITSEVDVIESLDDFYSTRVESTEIESQALEVSIEESSAKYQLLLADDNIDLLQYLKSYQIDDIDIHTASNGNEALAYLRDNYVDIVVSDISMPEMDGYELCQFIKQNESFSHIPIVLLSAITDQGSKLKGLECGADVYLEKPVMMDYLLAQVYSIINLRKKAIQKMNSSSIGSMEKAYDNIKEQQFIGTIRSYIEENILRPDIPITELANHLSVSRTVFYNKVKMLTGKTPNDFVRTIRLKKAAEYLRTNTYRINEVCYLVGFNNPSYFSRCFFNEFGSLPKNFIA